MVALQWLQKLLPIDFCWRDAFEFEVDLSPHYWDLALGPSNFGPTCGVVQVARGPVVVGRGVAGLAAAGRRADPASGYAREGQGPRLSSPGLCLPRILLYNCASFPGAHSSVG